MTEGCACEAGTSIPPPVVAAPASTTPRFDCGEIFARSGKWYTMVVAFLKQKRN